MPAVVHLASGSVLLLCYCQWLLLMCSAVLCLFKKGHSNAGRTTKLNYIVLMS